MQEQYWLTKVSLNFSPKTGRTTIFTLQLRVIKHRLMFCKNLSSSSKKRKVAGKKLKDKKVIINVKADLICLFSLSLGPFEAILLPLVWKKCGNIILFSFFSLNWSAHHMILRTANHEFWICTKFLNNQKKIIFCQDNILCTMYYFIWLAINSWLGIRETYHDQLKENS